MRLNARLNNLINDTMLNFMKIYLVIHYVYKVIILPTPYTLRFGLSKYMVILPKLQQQHISDGVVLRCY